MSANEYRAICNALIRRHHERLLFEAVDRDDATAIAHELKILSQLKVNI